MKKVLQTLQLVLSVLMLVVLADKVWEILQKRKLVKCKENTYNLDEIEKLLEEVFDDALEATVNDDLNTGEDTESTEPCKFSTIYPKDELEYEEAFERVPGNIEVNKDTSNDVDESTDNNLSEEIGTETNDASIDSEITSELSTGNMEQSPADNESLDKQEYLRKAFEEKKTTKGIFRHKKLKK